ncbi:hypothetical protein MPTK1_4g04700 [Marchantia polymorpha subsp. ruderalis]|uniref:Uncharacterized protein n=2 Tax=Marchantia polymorpha TaxID=3197 RepID=A0AAF6B6E3_MARPO|nr:hypothetical protein MARPO_0044s0004 [Marchantia polymorpha]BBN07577.1 hypothetical protein Mp_4g04700 [Marchantia polymorpha subsp. ruderalis]|eukprot:PTQ39522.1 hypothetical protein MARPO_0044s0004 [Marchantia polymorpha]
MQTVPERTTICSVERPRLANESMSSETSNVGSSRSFSAAAALETMTSFLPPSTTQPVPFSCMQTTIITKRVIFTLLIITIVPGTSL